MWTDFHPFDIVSAKISNFDIEVAQSDDCPQFNFIIFQKLTCDRSTLSFLEIVGIKIKEALEIIKGRFT